jgi:hypothetical protein
MLLPPLDVIDKYIPVESRGVDTHFFVHFRPGHPLLKGINEPGVVFTIVDMRGAVQVVLQTHTGDAGTDVVRWHASTPFVVRHSYGRLVFLHESDLFIDLFSFVYISLALRGITYS